MILGGEQNCYKGRINRGRDVDSEVAPAAMEGVIKLNSIESVAVGQ